MIQAETIIDGKYKLLKPIGYGGMASIFLAEDINTKTKFAIKVMDKRLANDKKLVHELGHPSAGIVKTYLVRIDSLLDEEQLSHCMNGMIVDEQGKAVGAGQSPEMGQDFLKFESVEQEQRK